jgi:hypothetical protein
MARAGAELRSGAGGAGGGGVGGPLGRQPGWTLTSDTHIYVLVSDSNRTDMRKTTVAVAKIEIELPDATAKAAKEAGLLTPQALDRLLTDAIRRRQAADALLAIADRVASAGVEPMSMEDIDAEVKAVRASRRQRAGGR